MKYLKEYKLFESQSYYQQMPFLSVDDALFDGYLDITDKALSISDEEIKWIKSMVNRIVGTSKIPLIIKPKKRHQLGGEGDDCVQVSVSFNNDIVLCIYKAEDEWWWVSTFGGGGDFKCDQRDGLEKMIEDIWNKNYKDYDFNLWYKLDYYDVYGGLSYISLGERLDLVHKYMDGISNDIEKEVSYLDKVQWVGLGSLDFIQKEYNDFVYIQSNRPHSDEDKYQGYNDDGNRVISNEKSYFFIYKNSENYYLLEDRTIMNNDGSQGYSEFYRCNSFEGVRSAIIFILRRIKSV